MLWWSRLRSLESRWRADVMWRGTVWSVAVTIAFCAFAILLLALLQLATGGQVRWS